MKRSLVLLLVLVMTLGMVACGGSKAVDIKSIVFTQPSITLQEGETAQVSITILPDSATEKVVWKSTDESIAVVDESGIVKAVAPGNTSIIASGEQSGNYSTCEIIVADPPAYDQLTDDEQKFVDTYVRYGYPEFVHPESIEIVAINDYEDSTYGKFWVLRQTNDNGFGGTSSNVYYLLVKSFKGSNFMKGDSNDVGLMFPNKSYNLELITRAIQEKANG